MFKSLSSFFQHKIAMLLLLLIILAGVLKIQSNKYHNWVDKEKLDRAIVRSDGAGYYAYLPQHLIYHDRNFKFIDSLAKAYQGSKIAEFGNYSYPGSGRMNKFFPGVALCQLPFFLTTHFFHDNKYPSDGYSYPYQRSIALGAICFLLLGVFLSYLVMIRLHIAPLAAALSLVGISLGTPLLFYTVNEPLASHVYSFAILALFLYLLLIWRDNRNNKWLPLIAMTLGLVVLLRPVNGIVILLYFALFPSIKDAWNFLRNHLFNSVPKIALVLLCFVSIVFLQYLNVYYQTGKLAFNLYSTETFENWNKPPMLEVLFGYRKGLFIYAPLTFLSLFALLFTYKKYRTSSWVTLFFFLVFTYITAAWWCWWYGGSIGMRPMVDISILYAVGVALLLNRGNWLIKTVTVPAIGFCIYFQFTLSHQFENGILHFDNMSKDRFNYVFLKTDRRFQWLFYVDSPKPLEEPEKISKTLFYDEKAKAFLETYQAENNHLEIEHADKKELLKYEFDSLSISKFKGLSLEGNMTIRDKNNIPLLLISIRKGTEWKQVQTDFVGMRIKDRNESLPFESDYIFPDDIAHYDLILIEMTNTHGRTSLDQLKIQFIEK